MKSAKLVPYRRVLGLLSLGLMSLAATALIPGDALAPATVVSAGATDKESAVTARSANGNTVVVWRADDGDQGGIFGMLYDDQGRPLTIEIAVNETTVSLQTDPAVAMNASGAFVVAWGTQSIATGTSEIFVRQYDAAGGPLGSSFQANAEVVSNQSKPAVAVAANGDFLVAWQSFVGGAAVNDIFARRFTAAGTAQTATDQRVNQNISNSQEDPSASIAADGSGLVAWTSFGNDAGGSGVFSRVISAAGVVTGDDRVLNIANSNFLETRPSIALAADGSLCAAWQAPTPPGDPVSQIYLRRFNASGAPLGDPLLVSSGTDTKSGAKVAADADGDCAVGYQSGSGSAAGMQYFRLVDRSQMPATEQLTSSASAMAGGLAVDADGDIALSYIETDGVKLRRHAGPEPVDLTTTLTAATASTAPGQTLRYTAAVSNLHAAGSGFSDTVNAAIGRADGVTLTVATPAGTTRSNIQADSQWNCAASTDALLSCTRKIALPPAATASLGFDLTMPASNGTVTATSAVAGLQSDPNAANSQVSRAVTVRNSTYQFVAVSGTDAQLSESGGTFNLQVTISPPAASTLRIPISTTGTASGGDYTLGSGNTLSIPAGASQATLTVRATADTLDEDDETLTLTLGAAAGAELGSPSSQTLTIVDDDGAPTVAFTTGSLSVGEAAGVFEGVVRVSTISSRDISVPFTVGGSATNSSDYVVSTNSPLVIPAGQTTGRIAINAVNDLLDEDNESVQINLGTPTNASLGTPTVLIATLVDNDPAPSIGFTVTSASLREGAGTQLVLRLSAGSAKAISGNLATEGSASANVDYSLPLSQFTIPAGSTEVALNLDALQDSSDEGSETLRLSLSGLVNVTARQGAASADFEIIDSNLPSARFAAASSVVAESAGTQSIVVQLSSPTETALTLPFTLSGEADGDDALVPDRVVRIPAGASSGVISVTPRNDTLNEGDERLILTLTQSEGFNLANPAAHVLTLTDDDAAPSLSLSATRLNLFEGESGSTQVRLSAPSGQPVQANLVVLSGSTASPADYSFTSTAISFAPGQTSITVAIAATTDTLVEGDETLQLELQNPVNARLGTPTQFVAVLSDPGTTPGTGSGTGNGSGDGLLNGGDGGDGGGGSMGLAALLPLLLLSRRRRKD